MRLVLALAISALGATTAVAQAAGDRYGFGPAPRAAARSAPQSLEAQGLRPLTWAHKAIPEPAPALAAAPQPAPIVQARGEVAGYGANRAVLPQPLSAPPWRPTAYQAFTPQAPYQAPPQQLAALTAPPPRTFAPPPAPVPTPARATTMPELAGGPAQRRPAPAPQVAQNGGAAVHYYSVHRGYGLTPDAIPEPPRDRGYVLIGPSETASAPKDRDRARDDDDDAKGDAPF